MGGGGKGTVDWRCLGVLYQKEMRVEPAQAVFQDRGTFLYSAQKLGSSERFDKSPYAVPSNTP